MDPQRITISAYKQLPVTPDQLRYVVIAIYNPNECKWVFAVSYALALGLAGAVLHFNRVPALIAAIAAGAPRRPRCKLIPTQHPMQSLCATAEL